MIENLTRKSRIQFVIFVALFLGSFPTECVSVAETYETQTISDLSDHSGLNGSLSSTSQIINDKWEEVKFFGGSMFRDFDSHITTFAHRPGKFFLTLKYDNDLLKFWHSKNGDKKILFFIDYQLIYNELEQENKDRFCNDTISSILYHREGDPGAHCRAHLFTGNQIDTTELLYCEKRRATMVTDAMYQISVELDYILPRQMYEINITMNWDDVIQERAKELSTKFYCTGDSRPLKPPIADQTSFDSTYVNSTLTYYRVWNATSLEFIDNAMEKLGENEELAFIYWRPVSKLLAGSSDFKYLINCNSPFNITAKPFHRLPNRLGKMLIAKKKEWDLECHIVTENNLGISQNFSRIVIPSKRTRLYLGKRFKLLAYEISKHRYRLEWTPFKVHSNGTSTSVEILASNSSMSSESSGSITLHWCTSDVSGDCQSLEGITTIKKATTSSYELNLPEYSPASNRLFGLAYTWKAPLISTGIVWAKCGAIHEDAITLKPMRIVGHIIETKAAGKPALSISWTFPDCDPIMFKITSYEFNYCQIPSSDICSLWGQSAMADPSNFPFKEDSETCTTTRSLNKFNEEETLVEMEPETKYYIRSRYILVNGTSSDWSVTIVVPANGACAVSWWLFISIPILLLLSASLYRKWTIWYGYSKSILYRFKDTRANVGDIVDMKRKPESEFMARKYCVNRETTDLASELTVNMLDGLLPNDQGDERKDSMDQSFDYIPRKLIENNTNETTPENLSDSMRDVTKGENSSEQDEISICSQSSFLNNILTFGTLNTSPSSESNS